ncbi:MAG: hypothetical protein V1918_05970, partial [Planctomycetota bacterium]
PALFSYATNAAFAGRFYIATEPLYLTLVASGTTFLWLFARRGGWGKALLAGVFFGLASLARSEGPALFAFLFLWLLVDQVFARRLWKRKSLLQTGLAALTMLVVLSPWLFYLRGVTGEWTLGGKVASKVKIREAFWKMVTVDDGMDFMKINYKLNSADTWMEESIWGISPWHLERMKSSDSDLSTGLSAIADSDRRWLGRLWEYFTREPGALVPNYAWLLIFLGFLAPRWGDLRYRWWLLLLFNLLPILLIAVSMGILPRNALHLLPLAAVATGKGLEAAGFLLRLQTRLSWRRKGFAIVASVVPVAIVSAIMLYQGVEGNRAPPWSVKPLYPIEDQAPEKDLALRLRESLPAGKTLMAQRPRTAVWAGLDWRVPPYTSQERLLRYIRNRGIDYALLEYWQLLPWYEPKELAPYLVEVFDIGKKMYLFKFTADGEAGIAPTIGASAQRGAGSP